MSSNEALLRDIYGDSSINDQAVESWKQRNSERQNNSEKSGNFFVPNYFLKNDQPIGVVNFLNEGKLFNLYRVNIPMRGTTVPKMVLAKGDMKGYLDAAGAKVTEQGVYAVVDWLHTYPNKNGDIVKRPQVKLLIRGFGTVQQFNKVKKSANQGKGTLLGRKWELERTGTGPQTVYIPDAQEECIPDFDAMMPIETKDGTIEIPVIQSYDWPEYETTFEGRELSPDEQSLYTQNSLKPDEPMDWNDPKKVDKWIELFFLTTSMAEYKHLSEIGLKDGGKKAQSSGKTIDYTQQAVSRGPSAKAASTGSEDSKQAAPKSVRDIPVADESDDSW